MCALDSFNPIAAAVYFIAVCAVCVFGMNPVFLFCSLAGAVLTFMLSDNENKAKTNFGLFVLFFVMALINPLVYHNGVTVLFVLNDKPITLEALLYGLCASATAVAVLYWFCVFSSVMTSDKLLYLFGALSPKFALVLSMALRYVPLFARQARKINKSQKALGLYKEDNIVDSIKGGLGTTSALTTWALENGIITADSMAARGYGIGKRSHFSRFSFRGRDFLLIFASLALFTVSVVGLKKTKCVFYPAFSVRDSSFGIAGYTAYALLVLLPAVLKLWEVLRWKYLKSKI